MPLDRSTPPAAAAVRAFRFPSFEHHRPVPGLQLYLAPSDRAPIVHLDLLTGGGGQFDPPGRTGLAALTAAMLDEGTATRDAMAIAGAAERLGGYLASGADWDAASVSTGLLAPHLDAGLELLLDVATRPSFPASELERLRRRTLTELRNRRAQPAALAQKALAAALYGDAPYGHFLLGTEQSVAAIRRDEVVEFYRRRLCGGPLRAVAVGDLDPQRLTAKLVAALGELASPAASESPAIRPRPRSAVEVVLVDRPGAAQTELRIGHPGIARSHPDHTAATLLNSILGGKFISRINLNLRERHGYTYGAHSRFHTRLGPGPFVVDAAVANEVVAAAAGEILAELRRIRESPVDEQELDDARSYLLGVFPYTVQTLQGIASRLGELAVYALPDDYYDEMPRRLQAVTAADIQRVARAHLHPDQALIVAVGPRQQLQPQLETLGPVSLAA